MKTVKKLSGLEIDEVSLVDRPANQHGVVAFTKRAEDGPMYYDADGNPVDEADLRDGDVVYTSNEADAEELVMLSDETAAQLQADGMSLEDFLSSIHDQADSEGRSNELTGAGVGKSFSRFGKAAGGAAAVTGGPSTAWVAGKKKATRKLGLHDGSLGHGRRLSKSLSESVLEDLSKALDDSDRDQVISKVAEAVSKAEQRAAEAIAKAERLEAQAEFNEMVDIAKGYQLPIADEELAEILVAVSKVLTTDQCGTLDRILTAAGVAVQTDELGAGGYAPSNVMDMVYGEAGELVGKAGGSMSPEMASTALFSANPEAYDEYLYETR